jgi:surface carbohydrate biosynthesis protein (TIGR04326 family)
MPLPASVSFAADTSDAGMRSRTLTLWDSNVNPTSSIGRIYRWNGYAEEGLVYSLLRYVESHGAQLRNKYLEWIHDIGESRIEDKRLIDHLAFEDGLSYWWMTLLVEMSPYKSPITDAIRLLAMEEIIVQQGPDKFRLVSANRMLHEVFSGLCQELGIAYEWERLSDRLPRRLSLSSIYHALPHSMQAFINLGRHLLARWPFRHTEKSGWFGGDHALFFCSYSGNFDAEAAEQGCFNSHYWSGLHARINRTGCKSNWLMIYTPCRSAPTPHAAASLLRRFNQAGQQSNFHSFLYAYLSWIIVLRVIKRWLGLGYIFWQLTGIKRVFRLKDSSLSLWPLMKSDWKSSMCGSVAIDNLLWVELFDVAMRDMPYQRKGLYLCENQAWERALIHTWRKHGHGQLIAVPHGAVRFWHLSYFSDPRTIRSSDSRSLPQPNLTALNGKVAVDAYLSVDYPKEAIVECEALRYGHLNNLRAEYSSKKANGGAIKVLILGDYLPSSTIKTLQLLEVAAPRISALATYTVKPHPYCLVKATDYPSLHLKIVTDSLGEILHDYDVAYSSNMTSAALDVYLAGLPVVVMLDETEINLSPLRGQSGVKFVGTPGELAEALQMRQQPNAASRSDISDFFFLDPELPRWSRLLAN